MKKIEKIESGRVYPNQTNDLIDNVEELDRRLKKVEESGGSGTGGNSYLDFELKPSSVFTETFPNIEGFGVLRIQGGMFQVYLEIDFSDAPLFADSSGFIMNIVDRNDYVKNLLLSQNNPAAPIQGVANFTYKGPDPISKEKAQVALILPGFITLEELAIYFFTGDEFDKGSNVKTVAYIGSGLIGPIKGIDEEVNI